MFSGRFTKVVMYLTLRYLYLIHEFYTAQFKRMHYHYLPSQFRQLTEQIDKLSLDSSKCLFRTTMTYINNCNNKKRKKAINYKRKEKKLIII